MLHAGLDLSRNRLDVCLLSEHAEVVEEFAAPADADGLRGLARRVGVLGMPVRGVIESMTGARFVHDRLEQLGWLRDGAERISTLDLVGPELTRFTGPDGAADRPTPDRSTSGHPWRPGSSRWLRHAASGSGRAARCSSGPRSARTGPVLLRRAARWPTTSSRRAPS